VTTVSAACSQAVCQGSPAAKAVAPAAPASLPAAVVGMPLPTELQRTMHPAYVIEPPDVLDIDAIRIVPRPGYRLEPSDSLLIQVDPSLPDQPVAGSFAVAADGTVNLGSSYGMVRVAGLTLEQAAAAIRSQLGRTLHEPQVAVALACFRGLPNTRGKHLVGQDGTITLGSYGCVKVAGLTLTQARQAVEQHLAPFLLDPEVGLSVAAFNSKVYYVIVDEGILGQQVFRFPITGNETVLDALGQVNGLPPEAAIKKMWLARPGPASHAGYQMLPIDWRAIVQAGDPATNYQLFPGDRIYVKAPYRIAIHCCVGPWAPVEQHFGATLLGPGAAPTSPNPSSSTGS
jgi:polysaccharide export outer membrane protein